MKLIRYIENRFQEAQFELNLTQAKNEYSAWRDAEIKALHNTLGRIRALMVWMHTPFVFVGWALVNLGLVEAPRPILMEMELKRREDAERAKKVATLMGKDTPAAECIALEAVPEVTGAPTES